MKLSKFWIYLILILFIIWLGGWYWIKSYLKKLTPTSTPIVKKIESKTETTTTTTTKKDKDIKETTSTEEIDAETTITDTSITTWDKEIKNIPKSKYSYILISWLSASLNLQNTLVALYNTELKNITYLPYDYYIEEYESQKDISIWNLSIDQIRDYLTSKWITIIDQVNIDQDVIFDLFTSIMSWDEYVITYEDEKWQEIDIPIKTKAHLYNLISKDNLNQYKNLEQLHNTILNLLIKNNITIWQVFKTPEEINFTKDTLYKIGDFGSITEKWFEKKQINWKFFLVDNNHKYLEALISWDFTNYKKYLEEKKKEKESESITNSITEVKKETLQEKLERLKKEKNATINSTTVTQNTTTESLADRLKRLRERQ